MLLLPKVLPALAGILLLGAFLTIGYTIDRARPLGGVLAESLPPPEQLTREEEVLLEISRGPLREVEVGEAESTGNPGPAGVSEERVEVTHVVENSPQTDTQPRPLRGQVLLGFYLQEFPPSMSAFYEFEEAIDKHVDILRVFKAWGDSDREFDLQDFLPFRAHRTTPLISWEPWRRREFLSQTEFNLPDIAAGRWDDYIRRWARGVRAYEGPILIEFAHEMNTPPGEVWWYPWQGDPEAYVAAFRHIVDIFREEGATNAVWVWSPRKTDESLALYYPGDDYVDWVGLTVLNFGTVTKEGTWQTFSQLFAWQYPRLGVFGKPIIIIEVASAEQGGSKAEWIRDLFRDLEFRYPLVRAVVWFNRDRAREYPQINWKIGSSGDAFYTFKEVIHRPFIGFRQD